MPKMSKKKKAQEKKAREVREKEEFAKRIIKENLDRELRFTNEQVSEIRRKVFETAQMLNLPLIKEEYLHKWGYFERTIDWKDYYISILKDDLFYYEVQQRISEQSHMENINKIIELYQDQINKIHVIYDKEKEYILKKRDTHGTRLMLTQNRRIENIESLMLKLAEEREKEFKKTDYENIQEKHAKLGQFSEAVENIAKVGDKQMEKLWGEMKAIFDKYKRLTQKKRKEFLILKYKDSKERIVVDSLNQRIVDLHAQIKEYRSELFKVTNITKVIEDLNLEKQKYQKAYCSLRNSLKGDSELDQKQVTYLSNLSSGVIKKLERMSEKAAAGLRLLSICRKLQTEEEKVIPRLEIGPPLKIFNKEQSLVLLNDMEQMWARNTQLNMQNKHMKNVLQKLLTERELLILKMKVTFTDMAGFRG